MSKLVKLKPCPFCDGKNIDYWGYEPAYIRCLKCGAQIETKNRIAAVRKWNRRAK